MNTQKSNLSTFAQNTKGEIIDEHLYFHYFYLQHNEPLFPSFRKFFLVNFYSVPSLDYFPIIKLNLIHDEIGFIFWPNPNRPVASTIKKFTWEAETGKIKEVWVTEELIYKESISKAIEGTPFRVSKKS